MLRKLILICGLTVLIVPLAAGRQAKGKGKGHQQDNARVAVGVFVNSDRGVLRAYTSESRGSLPPGLARRNGDLPPGLAKQLVRKGHLPPGLEKRIVPFPVELERRLSPLEPGLQRGFIGGRAVIFNRSTRVILDVFIPLD